MQTDPGTPLPLGFSIQGDRGNFSLFSSEATSVTLCLFWTTNDFPDAKIQMHQSKKNMWHVSVYHLPHGTRYAYSIEKEGSFATSELATDPYAKILWPQGTWGDRKVPRLPILGAAELPTPFDWEGIAPPHLPLNELILYEMHVRGFTADRSSQCRSPGTFSALIEKIPYLVELGITAVELMPIFEFDETHCLFFHPETKEKLINYWGYDPLHFFALMNRFCENRNGNLALQEFKTLVRELHRHRIEIYLDVVYNHTGEGPNYSASFQKIDKSSYYILDEQRRHLHFTGCSNTFNANNPAARKLIMDSLIYWAEEMHVDGFRFDLASCLTRGEKGTPLVSPPLFQEIAQNSTLQRLKLIAEPWDAVGLYQLGQFSKWGHWAEWNGQYRDHVRRFIKGTNGEIKAFANAVCGSEMQFNKAQTPFASINFITAHDGFCLRDLVSYQKKRNFENGENNRDGTDYNENWNCGAEGNTKDRKVLDLRERQMRNFFLTLFTSQGIPMLLMGDEIGHTRQGNNNPYLQDNEINWFNWNLVDQNRSILQFVASLIYFRKKNPILTHSRFLKDTDVDWHGLEPFQPDWSSHSRFIAFTLKSSNKPSLYLAFNSNSTPVQVTLPPLSSSANWTQIVDTALSWEEHHLREPELAPNVFSELKLDAYSSVLLQKHLR